MHRCAQIHAIGNLVGCGIVLIGVIGCGASSDGGANAKGGSGNSTVGGSANIAGGAGGGEAGGGGLSLGGSGTAVGGSSAVGGTQGAGGSSVVAATGTLGQPCSTPGALACNGINQKLTLVCGASNTWQTNQTCNNATQVCDPRPGSTAGTCQSPDPECLANSPGVLFCKNGVGYACDAWGMTSVPQDSCFACLDTGCVAATGCPSGSNVHSCASTCPPFDSTVCASGSATSASLYAALTTDAGYVQSAIIHVPGYSALGTSCGTNRRFWILDAPLTTVDVRVRVPAGWFVVAMYPGDTIVSSICLAAGTAQCLVANPAGGASRLVVYTDNPSANETNISVERGTLSC